LSASQSLVLSWANLRGIRMRAVASLVAMLGFAGVSTMLVVLLSGREAIRAMYDLAGRDNVAVVMSGTSSWETSSFVQPNLVLEIARMPGIARTEAGPVISKEFVGGGLTRLPSPGPGRIGRAVTGRGVTPVAFEVRREFRIVSGRNFGSGKHEVIVGRALAEQHQVPLGSEVRLGRANLKVVGIFASLGGTAEMEVWADKPVYEDLVVMHIGPSPPGPVDFSSTLWVRLAGPNGLRELNDAIAASTTEMMKRSKIHAITEREFFTAQSRDLVERSGKAAIAVGLVMGLGALFGAINTMYAAVAYRSREIATLRALGFQSLPVAVSVMSEALVLSVCGGVIGAALAVAVTRNLAFTVYNDAASSNIALHFMPTPEIVLAALGYVLLLGVISSVLPCIRALRGSIPAGLFAR
jgi:putative ABC transport system permease protein